MSFIAPLFVILALAVLSESTSVPLLPVAGPSASASAGVVGGQFAQQEGSQETHNDKNLSFNFDKKQGSSSNFKNTAAQAGAAHGSAQVHQPVYPGWGWAPPVNPGWGYPHGWGHFPGWGR